MVDIQLGAHTIKSHGKKVLKVHLHDWLILVLLIVIDVILNIIEPFHRFVGKDMMTDLRYPFKGNTIPFWAVPVCYLKTSLQLNHNGYMLTVVQSLYLHFAAHCNFTAVYNIYWYLLQEEKCL